MKTKTLILLALFYLTVGNSQVIYVKKEAQGLNNGQSWENAYTDLDYAIEKTENGEIWVSSGVYIPSTDLEGNIPTNEELKTFRLKKNVAIYGGFVGNETALNQRDWINNKTVLSGDIGIKNDMTDNVRHVVSGESELNENTKLDGLTIRDGYSYSQYSGAGIYAYYTGEGKFIVRNCIIENNHSFRYGGGIYIFYSQPIIENNTFQDNKSFEGGAIYLSYSNAVIKDNIIINNTAKNYPGITSGSLSGGGIHVGPYSSPKIINNVIKKNIATNKGGGITIDSNYNGIIFQGNLVTQNKSVKGGGVYLGSSKTYFFNNIFNKNIAIDGGGIYIDYNPGSPEFINNIIYGNMANKEGGGIYSNGSNINIVNSIVFKNTPSNNQIRADSWNGNWAPKIRYSNIEHKENGIVSTGNILIFENNLNEPPMFVDVDNNNFNLEAQSNLIDSGTISSDIISNPWSGSNGEIIDFPSTDYIGNPRIIANIDIGAYEFNSTLNIPVYDLQNFAFYPNPSDGVFNFSSQLSFDYITIYDINGRKLKRINKESNINSINLSNYNNGVYIAVIKLKKMKHYYKIILNK